MLPLPDLTPEQEGCAFLAEVLHPHLVRMWWVAYARDHAAWLRESRWGSVGEPTVDYVVEMYLDTFVPHHRPVSMRRWALLAEPWHLHTSLSSPSLFVPRYRIRDQWDSPFTEGFPPPEWLDRAWNMPVNEWLAQFPTPPATDRLPACYASDE